MKYCMLSMACYVWYRIYDLTDSHLASFPLANAQRADVIENSMNSVATDQMD